MKSILSRLILCITLALMLLESIGQTGQVQHPDDNVDSPLSKFLSVLDTIPEAEEKIMSIIRFAYKNRFDKFLFPLTKEARQIAHKSNNKKLIASSLEFSANYHQYNYNLDSSQYYYKLALTKVEPNNLKAASIFTAYGGLMRKKGDIPMSIEYSLQAKKIYEQLEGTLPDKTEVKRVGQYGTLLNSLANIFNNMEDFESANSYYEQAQSQFRIINDTLAAGIILSNKGELLNTLERYEEALVDLLESKKLKESVGASKRVTVMSNYHIAYAYAGLGKTKDANDLYKSVIADFESINYDFGKALAYTQFGMLSLKQNQFQEAYTNCVKGNEYGMKANLLEVQEESFECLYQTLKSLGRAEEALDMHEAYVVIRDSIKNEKNTKLITQMEMNYAHQQEEAAIQRIADEKARKNRLIISSLSGIIFSLFLISYLIYRSLVHKRRSQKVLEEKNNIISTALSEKDILLREIHHRVKNNLQVISSLLSLQTRYTDDPHIALAIKSGKDRVKAMTLIHQNLYQRENLTGIQVDDYFEKLIKSLFQSYNISPDRISLQTDIDALNLDVETAVPMGLIANELITNSLKYAFPGERVGSIKVSLKEKGNKIILSVLDNGVGFSDKLGSKKEGFGLELVDAFKQKLNADVSIESNDGTSVILEIKDYQKIESSSLKLAG